MLAAGESAEALDGLAQANWGRADTNAAISARERAYVGYRRKERAAEAALVGLRLWEEYEKALALDAVASGWLARAQELLADLEETPVRGRLLLAEADRAVNPEVSEGLATKALQIARQAGDPDVELIALGKLGLAQIARGRVDDGVTHFDQAMAAATSGEPNELRTLGDLYCSLFLAMELIQDSSRFEQWTEVVMGFVQRHNHPELLTFCGTCCAELFAAAGRWKEVENQLLDTLHALEANWTAGALCSSLGATRHPSDCARALRGGRPAASRLCRLAGGHAAGGEPSSRAR